MHFKLPLRLSSKRLSRCKRPPSPPPTPPATSDMSGGKGQPVVIELDDSSDEEEDYQVPFVDLQSAPEPLRFAEEDADNNQLPFFFPHDEDLEPFANEFVPFAPEEAVEEETTEPVDPEQLCLDRVLEVFPDIDHEYVRQLYKDRLLAANGGPLSGNASEDLILKILDGGTYPKEKERRTELKRKRAASAASSEVERAAWEAADRDRASAHYSEEALRLLKDEFPYIPTRFVDQSFKQHGHLYPTYFALEHEERSYHERQDAPYHRLKNPRKPKANSSLSQSHHLSPGAPVTDLLKELEAARIKHKREKCKRQLQKDEEDAEATNEKEYREANMMVECHCCFSDLALNKATHCDGEEPHFFCFDCAKRNANNEIGNSRYKLRCMDCSGCKADFAKEQIRRFLDQKTIDTLERLQQQEEIRLADLDDLTSCPFCDFAAICAPVEEDREFRCANPECEKVSCRLCKHETHIPLTCEAYAKDNKVTVRHAVEEAMTEALVRSCHKCKNKYIKETGCNKMMCMRCMSIQCYVCSKDITKNGYTHFNESARGGRPGQCPLFDNTEQRHDDDVKRAEQKALEKVRAENPEFSEEELKIKVSHAVGKTEKDRIHQAGVARGFYPLPRMPDMAGRPFPHAPLQPPVVDFNAQLAAINAAANERGLQAMVDANKRGREMNNAARARIQVAEAQLLAAQGRLRAAQRQAQAARGRAQAAQDRAQARAQVQAPPPAPPQAQPFAGMAYPMHYDYGAQILPPGPFGGPYLPAFPGYPVMQAQPALPPQQVFMRPNQDWQVREDGQPDGDMANIFGYGDMDRP